MGCVPILLKPVSVASLIFAIIKSLLIRLNLSTLFFYVLASHFVRDYKNLTLFNKVMYNVIAV